MPCYHPLPGWYATERNPTGKRSIVFSPDTGFKDRPVSVPCGRCIGCRLERARTWAIRCVHEVNTHEDSCFVTLTYDDKHLPINGSLRPRDFVLFMKKLRHVAPGIRFFQCGEYGDETQRPHHHALLFGWNPPDRVFYKGGQGGSSKLYVSELLDKTWGYGQCSVGEASYQSAGYIARYSMKKVGKNWVDVSLPAGKVPPYMTMSRRPGIGHDWAKLYCHEWYRNDFLVHDGQTMKPPRYYESVAAKVLSPEILDKVKVERRLAAAAAWKDNTGRRLVDREAIKEASISRLSRNLEA